MIYVCEKKKKKRNIVPNFTLIDIILLDVSCTFVTVAFTSFFTIIVLYNILLLRKGLKGMSVSNLFINIYLAVSELLLFHKFNSCLLVLRKVYANGFYYLHSFIPFLHE